MLDAACAGEVFTSPTPDQMLEATKAVDGGAGVLHIVKNYTGDVMNFEMAAELAAAEPASRSQSVVTDDDVAVQDSPVHGRPPRRRRHRAAGEDRRRRRRGGPRPRRGRRPRPPGQRNGRSMGMALTSARSPPPASRRSTCREDEMEIGIGIHGEPGRHRVPLASAAEIAEQLVEPDPRRPATSPTARPSSCSTAWAAPR